MCICNPKIKTPFCGKVGCEWPDEFKKKDEFELKTLIEWMIIQCELNLSFLKKVRDRLK